MFRRFDVFDILEMSEPGNPTTFSSRLKNPLVAFFLSDDMPFDVDPPSVFCFLTESKYVIRNLIFNTPASGVNFSYTFPDAIPSDIPLIVIVEDAVGNPNRMEQQRTSNQSDGRVVGLCSILTRSVSTA